MSQKPFIMHRNPYEHSWMTNGYHTVRFTKNNLDFHDFSWFFHHFWSKKGGLFLKNRASVKARMRWYMARRRFRFEAYFSWKATGRERLFRGFSWEICFSARTIVENIVLGRYNHFSRRFRSYTKVCSKTKKIYISWFSIKITFWKCWILGPFIIDGGLLDF